MQGFRSVWFQVCRQSLYAHGAARDLSAHCRLAELRGEGEIKPKTNGRSSLRAVSHSPPRECELTMSVWGCKLIAGGMPCKSSQVVSRAG